MTKSIVVEVTDDEFADLNEMVTRHPKDFPSEGDALKHMAGLAMYRQLKQTTDPERKKSPILVQDLGIPEVIPCAMWDLLNASHQTYQDFVNGIVFDGLARAQAALDRGQFREADYTDRYGRVHKAIALDSPELREFANTHPGIMLVSKVDEPDKPVVSVARTLLVGAAQPV